TIHQYGNNFHLENYKGWPRIKKISRSIRRAPRSASALARSLRRGRGGFPIRTEGKPPRLRQLRWLRKIFLMTQTPLLAVMQGGESRSIPIFSQLVIDCPYRRSTRTKFSLEAEHESCVALAALCCLKAMHQTWRSR